MSERHDQFKKSSDIDAARRSRHESSVAIRKAKKNEQMAARRARTDNGAPLESTPATYGAAAGAPLAAVPGVGAAAAAAPMSVGRTEGLSEVMQKRLAQLPQYIEGIYSNDRQRVHAATEGIRKLLSIERKPPIEEVIATNVVPRLVQLIAQEESHELQFEAAWALTNIASGTTHHTKVVIDAGAVPIFVRLLNSPNADVREQAIWALGNIAGDAVKYRNMVLELGAMPLLLEQLQNPGNKITVLRNGTWTLSNFCRGKPAPPIEIIMPALRVLSMLITVPDDDVITDVCWALSYISDGSNERIDAVIASGVCPRLVELLCYSKDTVQTPALRAIGNIVTGTDEQTQVILNLGALQSLILLLGAPKPSLVKETCWTLSNITAGLPNQVQAVIDAGIIPALIALLDAGDFDVRKEAAWAVSNATSGTEAAHTRYVAAQGAIRPFCKLLLEKDTNVVVLALDCLENILKVGEADRVQFQLEENPYVRVIDECGGINYIEDLQLRKEPEVAKRAVQVIEKFFGVEDGAAGAYVVAGGEGQTFMNAGFGGPPPPGSGAPGAGAAAAPFQFNFR